MSAAAEPLRDVADVDGPFRAQADAVLPLGPFLEEHDRLDLLDRERQVDQALGVVVGAAGGTYDDTEGLINLPLTVKEIQAVVFFKEWTEGQYRVSLRSKGAIDVGDVAKRFGGGGHKNASGCTVYGDLAAVRDQVLPLVAQAVERGAPVSVSHGE